MRSAALLLLLLALVALRVVDTAAPAGAAVLAELPDHPDRGVYYLFYLHGQIVEDQGIRPRHPHFGVYEYGAILDTLADRALTVVSEARPAGTEVTAYAEKVAGQVRHLLAAGVPADHIAVAGHSKGGAIAITASSLIADEGVSYVILAACGSWLTREGAPRLSGRVLSIVEASDDLAGTCAPAFARARRGTRHQEIRLSLGGGHGVFYHPRPEWLDPLVRWVKHETWPQESAKIAPAQEKGKQP